MEEPDYIDEQEERRKQTWIAINKAIAFLFVFGIYMVIFLKIILLK